MNDESIDHYSEVIKEQARNESDKIRDLKRKIEDNTTIEKELKEEEFNLLLKALENEAGNLEKAAKMSKEILEEKINAADQN